MLSGDRGEALRTIKALFGDRPKYRAGQRRSFMEMGACCAVTMVGNVKAESDERGGL
jgi:hypothetical protein